MTHRNETHAHKLQKDFFERARDSNHKNTPWNQQRQQERNRGHVGTELKARKKMKRTDSKTRDNRFLLKEFVH